MKDFLRKMRGEYDRFFFLTFFLYIFSYCAGALIVGGQDHHGAWEWVGWICFGLSLVWLQIVTGKLRKGRQS